MKEEVKAFDLDEKKPDLIHEYEIRIPKQIEYHADKVLNDPAFIYGYLSGNTEVFYNSENFERKFLSDLPKLLWNSEKLEDIGDFVLLFPNPDKVAYGLITQNKAMDDFDDIFNTPFTYASKTKFLRALKVGYEQAFLELNMEVEEVSKQKKVSRFKKQEDASQRRVF